MENLAGKNVLAFGAGGGMGAAINKVLLEGNVKNLVVSDYCEINEHMQKVLDENKNVFYEKGDVSNKEFIKSTFKKYFDKFGYIDLVLNLAAILDENRVERTQEINLVRLYFLN
jgi:NAD(P)-dependent dehydrogenase (short-subunit alcohol dehydrogenase family)